MPTEVACSSTRSASPNSSAQPPSCFGHIDRDLAVCGALLHDIGKLEAYAGEHGCADLTDAGKLEGEIPLGYYRVRREIESIPGFPRDLARALLHVILAHHGCLEYGSPVVPGTREAALVHAIDNLSGQLGAFDRLREADAAGRALVALRPGPRRLRVPRRLWGCRMTNAVESLSAPEGQDGACRRNA